MSRPRVSVVIPTHNEARFIEASVRSMLRQSLAPFEVLIVDDCSEDDTLALCHALSHTLAAEEPRIRVFAQSRNLGPSAARNFGADQARGDVLCFVEADGIYSRHYLRRCVQGLDAAGCVISGGGLRRPMRTDTRWGRYWAAIFEARWQLLATGRAKPIGAWVFPKAHFDRVGGYDPHLRYGEDVALVRQMVGTGCRLRWERSAYFFHNEPDGWLTVWRKFYRGAREGWPARAAREGRIGPLIKSLLAVPLFVPVFFLVAAPLLAWSSPEVRIAWWRIVQRQRRGQGMCSDAVLFPYQYLWARLAAVAGILAGALRSWRAS